MLVMRRPQSTISHSFLEITVSIKNFFRLSICVATLLVAEANLFAGDITGLFNTGVDGSGNVLPDHSVDAHWAIVGGGTNFVLGPATQNGGWVADNSTSQWDSAAMNGNEGVANFDNRTTFTSPVTGTVTITGNLATDDNLQSFILDGVNVTGSSTGTYGSFTAFTIVGAVTAGLNTLDVNQFNTGDPGAFNVAFTAANATPEPASFILCGLGAIGLLVAVRRRRK
jgi:hypothetical protein